MTKSAGIPYTKKPIQWGRWAAMAAGVVFFTLIYFSPAWPDAVDPMGKHFALSREGKGALAVFMLAGTWWVFEVVPIGITSLVIGVLQAMFMIRTANAAFKDFMTPSVMFIFGSIVIGMVFTKTGLTKRLAYKMLSIVGERTSMIMLGCFVVTAVLTHVMAHTAVAATIYPLLVAIYSMYDDDNKPTKFGLSLFMGMAYVAGAGSIITLLGAARGAVAIGFFSDIVKREIGFLELSYHMAPVGWLMIFLLWGFFMVFSKPEQKTIPGLKERANRLYENIGPITRNELLAAAIVVVIIVLLSASSAIPADAGGFAAIFKRVDKTAVLLCSTVLFYILKILNIDDLEAIPWNIILLFGGAMSIGFCLWETGAAQWLAINWLVLFQKANWFVFVLGISFFVMVMTNFIMNVAAIAISLPVALVIAPYLGVAPEVIFYSSLVAAGMPFMLLVGAAPNAIAYDSKQFTSGQFFLYGLPASLMLMVVIGVAALFIWPAMGMPVSLSPAH
ncbi:MAG: SLC13/DASS family transporter [Deltaproteobacteria bacterium]|nr:SLC13/DASS family transporter [Deltaproteobacteria bacterium]